MTKLDRFLKRTFDIFMSSFGLIILSWLIIISVLLAKYDTKLSGFFRQNRVGKNGKIFKIFKLRSMKNIEGYTTTVSTDKDPRITSLGRFWRKTKIDELPQLINVFLGDMSFVGPRPDVPGFADTLEGEDRIILTIRPGITGPASIYFKNEEALLSVQQNPEQYNREVIWSKKVEINKKYIKEYNFLKDIGYIIKTVI